MRQFDNYYNKLLRESINSAYEWDHSRNPARTEQGDSHIFSFTDEKNIDHKVEIKMDYDSELYRISISNVRGKDKNGVFRVLSTTYEILTYFFDVIKTNEPGFILECDVPEFKKLYERLAKTLKSVLGFYDVTEKTTDKCCEFVVMK